MEGLKWLHKISHAATSELRFIFDDPYREESELKRALSELCPGTIFDDAAVHQHYMTLASLIGGWLSEQARLETLPVKNALLTMAKNLGEASALLSGLETGVRSDIEIAVARRKRHASKHR